ncbi:MAG TPA: VanZ family protein [Pyrinomonadaceae bacterium]|nr:VanZ family protein [Pyrinomonadaceae bacterium]
MAQEQIHSKRRGRFFAYAPLFIWIGVVLFLGSGAGSMNETSRFVRPLLEFLFPSASDEIYLVYHGFIRKFAHFFEYAVLAYLAQRAFSRSPAGSLSKRPILIAFILIAAVAIIDEANQSFIASRTSSPHDVLLDISGGCVILALVWFFRRRPLTSDNRPPTGHRN